MICGLKALAAHEASVQWELRQDRRGRRWSSSNEGLFGLGDLHQPQMMSLSLMFLLKQGKNVRLAFGSGM